MSTRHESDHAADDLRAYYGQANADPDFQEAIAPLYAEVRAGRWPPEAKLRSFVEKWALPRGRGMDDLRWSLRLAALKKAKLPRLLWAWRRRPTPRILRAIKVLVQIDPHDPSRNFDAAIEFLKKRKREVIAALQEQGWRRASPRRRGKDREEQDRMARRVWRRCALGLSWQDCLDDGGHTEDTNAVRLSVERWARRLGIALPKISSGRPPSKQR